MFHVFEFSKSGEILYEDSYEELADSLAAWKDHVKVHYKETWAIHLFATNPHSILLDPVKSYYVETGNIY